MSRAEWLFVERYVVFGRSIRLGEGSKKDGEWINGHNGAVSGLLVDVYAKKDLFTFGAVQLMQEQQKLDIKSNLKSIYILNGALFIVLQCCSIKKHGAQIDSLQLKTLLVFLQHFTVHRKPQL